MCRKDNEWWRKLSQKTKGWSVKVKGLASQRWRETCLPLEAEMNLGRGLEGKGRGKVRKWLPDCPVVFPRQASISIQSSLASLESLPYPS